TIALGTGLRWTIEQMSPEAAARVKADNVGWLQENGIDRVETNAIYALGTKRRPLADTDRRDRGHRSDHPHDDMLAQSLSERDIAVRCVELRDVRFGSKADIAAHYQFCRGR